MVIPNEALELVPLAKLVQDERCVVNYHVLYRRIKGGMPRLEAMTTPFERKSRKRKPRNGTLMQKLRDAGSPINYGTLLYRMKHGASFDEAVAGPKYAHRKDSLAQKIRDAGSLVSYQLVVRRIKSGMSVDEAVSTPRRSPHRPDALMRKLRESGSTVSYTAVISRMKKGMSFEEAITAPLSSRRGSLLRAHGKSTREIEMDRKREVTVHTVIKRLKKGVPYKEAIRK